MDGLGGGVRWGGRVVLELGRINERMYERMIIRTHVRRNEYISDLLIALTELPIVCNEMDAVPSKSKVRVVAADNFKGRKSSTSNERTVYIDQSAASSKINPTTFQRSVYVSEPAEENEEQIVEQNVSALELNLR